MRQHQQGQQLSTPGKEAQVGQQQVRTARKRELSLLGFCLRCRLKMRSFAETGSGLSESTNLKNSATCHLCVCVCAAGGKYCLGDAAALRALPGRPPPCPRPAASTPGRFRDNFGRGADGRSEKRCFLRHFLYEHGHFNQGRLGRKSALLKITMRFLIDVCVGEAEGKCDFEAVMQVRKKTTV